MSMKWKKIGLLRLKLRRSSLEDGVEERKKQLKVVDESRVKKDLYIRFGKLLFSC